MVKFAGDLRLAEFIECCVDLRAIEMASAAMKAVATASKRPVA